MSKQRRFITAFAAGGMLVAAFLATLVYLGDLDAAPALYVNLALICPPAFLYLAFGNLTGNIVAAAVLWLLIGLLNSGLYAVIGAAIAGQIWKPKE